MAKRCRICGQRFTNDAAFCPFDGEPLADAQGWDPNADPIIGTIIDGRYEVLRALGEGGMGVVYHVQHRVLQRSFALKMLRKDLARERDLCARFIQEARSAATIAHPNVVQITDYGELPDATPYFVMEFLEGLPLARLCRGGGPLPAARALRIVMQIASGVGAAHRAGIVHRDLKPDNVIVLQDMNRRDVVKLLDFGVAKVAGAASVTRTGMVFGSPHYMSPEQAAGQHVDHRADIYAIGVIMYEVFTGRVPFEADTFMGVLTKHMFMAPEPFKGGPGFATRELGALEEVTLRCLEKKPDARFPTTDTLIAAIEEVVQLGARSSSFDLRVSDSGGRRPSPAGFRLADEMEPPLSLEVSAARARQNEHEHRYQWFVLAMLGAAIMFLGVVGAVALSRFRSQPVIVHPQEAGMQVMSSPAVPVDLRSPAPSTPVAASALPVASPTLDFKGEPDDVSSVSQQERTQSKARRANTQGTSPQGIGGKGRTKGSGLGSGMPEIVNPWGN